jgi:ribonuclease J
MNVPLSQFSITSPVKGQLLSILDIHTGGHAQQEELKLMMQLVKPKYFIPIHGEHHMLAAHAKLAQSVGIPEDHCFVLENGSVMEINSAGQGKVLVMAQDGMFVIITTLDRRTGKMTSQPEILSRGFVYMKNNDDLIREVKHEVRKLVEGTGKAKLEPNWAYLRQQIRDDIGEYLFQKTQRRPMILPVVIEV